MGRTRMASFTRSRSVSCSTVPVLMSTTLDDDQSHRRIEELPSGEEEPFLGLFRQHREQATDGSFVRTRPLRSFEGGGRYFSRALFSTKPTLLALPKS